MRHFRLHTKTKGKDRLGYWLIGLACILTVGGIGYAAHSIGTASAKSRETVIIDTEEMFERYLVDTESEDYNLNGRYRLAGDLDLSWLEDSIGTNVEPFTGKMDGNGYVISGLGRPLFGVVEDAEIENLFLSEAEIGQPAVYYDGSHYVDGYGALAAYVIDSRIQNCGMGGTILTTSPVETEFLVAKASPAEAEELRGPGMERVPSIPEEGNTSTEVSGSGAQEAGPGMEAGGNGASGGESSDSDAGRETDAGPGVETDSQVESTSGENIPASTEDAGPGSSTQESEQETSPSIGSGEGETNPVIQESSESGTENAGSGGSQPATDSAGGGTQATQPETGRPETTQPEADQSETTQTESERPEATQPETANPETDPPETAQPEAGQSETAQPEMAQHKTAQPESGLTRTAKNMLEPETIGYRANERDYLMMKVSAVIDADTAVIPDATPSNAAPPDAEETFEESQNASGEDTGNADEEEIEYIGNPYGDIYILVTADQVSVGGLIAQTAGDTLILDSFAMVDLNSELEGVATYTGGLAGILGGETKTENSYVTGTVNGDDITGGFAAVNEGRIENCYSSISVGASGTSRGAFTAEGDGQLSGCVYDRQMACVDTEDIIQISGETAEAEIENGTETASEADFEREEPEFCLRGLDTIQMTGEDAQVPGRWHTTNQAYPQLEAFSQKEGGIAEIYSRASAIALILPEGTTLLDALSDSDILLPAEIDGAEILWEKEDGMGTNGAVLTPHEVPVLQQALAGGETGTGESDTGTADAGTASTSETDTETPESTAVEEPTPDIGETSGVPAVTFKATISNVTKIFAPVSQLAIEDEPVPADWSEVGKRVDTAGSSLESLKPEKNADGYYLIGSPEALAWFAYKVNTDNTNYKTAKALLIDDIDLAGLGYTKEPSVNSDFSNCLKWIPIGNDPSNSSLEVTLAYRGIFDGGNCEIKNLYIIGGAYHAGFFGTANSATIRNVKIISGSVQGTDRVGGILGASNSGTVLIENCYNAADIKAVLQNGFVACNTGGIVGAGFNASARLYVKNCVNKGAVSGYREGGGIIGTTHQGAIEIQNCYNLGTVTQIGTDHGTDGYGGIVGRGDCGKISNCYNAGAVIAESKVHAIAGTNPAAVVINNSYFQTGLQGAAANDSNTVGLEEEIIKSWPTAYALNEQSMTGPWKYTEGQYPDFGVLAPAGDWGIIGQGIEWGLIKNKKPTAGDGSAGSPYQISTPEALSWFACMVNSDTANQNWYGNLTTDISLVGTAYGGSSGAPIPWIPIGVYNGTDETKGYGGTFGAGHDRVYEIQNMHIKPAGFDRPGLFGQLTGTANISNIGMVDTVIESASDGSVMSAGSIAGRMMGTGTVISRCYSRNAEIHAGGVNGGVAGGITGGMESTSRIQDCYTMDSRILSTGTVATSSAFSASGIASSVPSGGTVKNCYAAGNTLTATKPGGEAGATYSIGNPVAAMAECYADNNTLGDKSKVKALEKTQAQADSLNTLDGSERQGDSRVWYTSLTAESTRGYPTFDKPVVLSVTVNPAEVTKNGATLNSSIGVWDGGVPPDGILFRAIHQEKRVNDGENQPAFHLTASSTVGDNFHIYGTDSSHEYLSVNVGNSDLASLASSLTDPTTALNTFQTSGSTQGLRVANGAAYIYPYDRILLLDLAVKNGSGGSSGITRYEVRIKVKAVTGKTLSVTMKTPVYITMEPGVTTTAYADDLVINNGNEYPVQFTVSSVEAIPVGDLASDNTRMDVELKPIASSVTIDDTKALTSQGIKLGITGPKTASDTGNLGTKKLYYTPSLGVDVPGTWMKADIAWNQSLGYRYFIDHSMLHIGPQQKFGFHITYQFSISNDDVAAVKVIEE